MLTYKHCQVCAGDLDGDVIENILSIAQSKKKASQSQKRSDLPDFNLESKGQRNNAMKSPTSRMRATMLSQRMLAMYKKKKKDK